MAICENGELLFGLEDDVYRMKGGGELTLAHQKIRIKGSRFNDGKVGPDGAFYLFVKALEDDAYKFFEKAKAHEILVVPCDDFGVSGYVRVAYCTDKAKVIGALPAFEALAKEYK